MISICTLLAFLLLLFVLVKSRAVSYIMAVAEVVARGASRPGDDNNHGPEFVCGGDYNVTQQHSSIASVSSGSSYLVPWYSPLFATVAKHLWCLKVQEGGGNCQNKFDD